jgi:hypothetical protein
MSEDKFRFNEVKRALQLVHRELPVKLANQAQNYFVKSWSAQGWDGRPWKTPKRRIAGTPEYKYPKLKDLGRRTRATLVGKQSGRLRRAVSNSIRSKTMNSVRLVVDLSYAHVHNEGSGRMPRRTFMKDSPILRKQQDAEIKNAFKDVFK